MPVESERAPLLVRTRSARRSRRHRDRGSSEAPRRRAVDRPTRGVHRRLHHPSVVRRLRPCRTGARPFMPDRTALVATATVDNSSTKIGARVVGLRIVRGDTQKRVLDHVLGDRRRARHQMREPNHWTELVVERRHATPRTGRIRDDRIGLHEDKTPRTPSSGSPKDKILGNRRNEDHRSQHHRARPAGNIQIDPVTGVRRFSARGRSGQCPATSKFAPILKLEP